MSAAVFEARWDHLNGLRKLGHEELTDFLGGYDEKLAPAVRMGLLRKRETGTEFQRYHGFVPTERGLEFLIHVPQHELIVVKGERKDKLKRELAKDPMPDGIWKQVYAEPISDQLSAVEAEALRNADRARELRQWLLCGYMDLRVFLVRHELVERTLIDHGLCADAADPTGRGWSIGVTSEGDRFLHAVKKWDLILVRPGLELPLFHHLDPERAEYWKCIP